MVDHTLQTNPSNYQSLINPLLKESEKINYLFKSTVSSEYQEANYEKLICLTNTRLLYICHLLDKKESETYSIPYSKITTKKEGPLNSIMVHVANEKNKDIQTFFFDDTNKRDAILDLLSEYCNDPD